MLILAAHYRTHPQLYDALASESLHTPSHIMKRRCGLLRRPYQEQEPQTGQLELANELDSVSLPWSNHGAKQHQRLARQFALPVEDTWSTIGAVLVCEPIVR